MRRQPVSRKVCRGVLSITMAFWLTLIAVGLSNFSGVTSVAGSSQAGQCSCDIQKQLSNNCCCRQKKSCCQRKTSCCTGAKTSKFQQDDPPQFNAYCGTSVPAGAIINREPRLSTRSLVVCPLPATWQTVEILDDVLCGSIRTVDLPPPKV